MSSQLYRYEVKDIDGFLSQLVRYVANGGHYFYVRVRVPEKKDPQSIAEKIPAVPPPLVRDIALRLFRFGFRNMPPAPSLLAGQTQRDRQPSPRPAPTRACPFGSSLLKRDPLSRLQQLLFRHLLRRRARFTDHPALDVLARVRQVALHPPIHHLHDRPDQFVGIQRSTAPGPSLATPDPVPIVFAAATACHEPTLNRRPAT